ncbi:MAG: metal ABC transporter substrate-binding protein [Acidimicrobiia bacterium]|nr:metal ABC transporter substrate-binding protein [Acidimicrobiia bacterium]
MSMRTTLILTTVIFVSALSVLAASCTSNAAETEGLRVVVTTSILGDIVKSAAGPGVAVEVIMAAGTDPHEFEPSARQVAAIRSADLVIANGLGLEAGLEDVLAAAAGDGVSLLEIGPAVDPLPLEQSGGDDPHVWLDPIRIVTAVDAVVGALGELDSSTEWKEIAAPYRQELFDTDDWVRTRLEFIPPDQRVLVTGHQAFGYFAARYDFEVVATILPGATTMIEPSASGFADVVEIVDSIGARAIFTDLGENQALAEQLADQAERTVLVVPLYTGSLGEPGSGAETYLGLIRWNTEAIAEAFK